MAKLGAILSLNTLRSVNSSLPWATQLPMDVMLLASVLVSQSVKALLAKFDRLLFVPAPRLIFILTVEFQDAGMLLSSMVLMEMPNS